MPGLSKIQRRIVRAFVAKPGVLLTTADLIRWSYPRRAEPIALKHFIIARRLKLLPIASAELIPAASFGS
jgi:hypothetical protein